MPEPGADAQIMSPSPLDQITDPTMWFRSNHPQEEESRAREAKTDVSIIDVYRAGIIALLIKEDKCVGDDPRPQLAAEATTALTTTTSASEWLGSRSLHIWYFHFFDRYSSLNFDRLLSLKTLRTSPHSRSPEAGPSRRGGHALDNRRVILQCYEAFKKFMD
ncbi:hypothetical protein K439DRAFT_1616274 [Ramaria rubella]|nr:hypothetical protein K439DRAFT_1616274 [Ramaria rubella]